MDLVARTVALALVVCALAGWPPASAQELLVERDGQVAFDRFGTSVAGAGDVNGDGWPDLVIGAPGAAPNGRASGRAQVFSGRDGSLLFQFDGLAAGDRLGQAVAGIGDVDGDTLGDIAVGAPGEDIAGGNAGGVYLLSGAGGTVIRHWSGPGERAEFGRAVAAAGDVDGDGAGDVIVGAPGEIVLVRFDYEGTVRLYSGRTGTQIREWSLGGAGDTFGWSVAGGTHLDGDGVPDILIGAPQFLRLEQPGCIFGVSGASGALIGVLYGHSAGDNFGWSIAGNAAGRFVVGAPLSAANAFQGGTVRVFRQGAERDAPLHGSGRGDYFGWSVADVGDINGDGAGDFAMGAPEHGGSPDEGPGYVRIHSGSDWSLLRTIHGAAAGGLFGAAVAGAGDLNRDGLADVVIGVPRDSRTLTEAGRAEIPFLCGARAYGTTAAGANTLTLAWQPQAASPRNGAITVAGGPASAPLTLFASGAAAQIPYGPLTILIDPYAAALAALPGTFNSAGSYALGASLAAAAPMAPWRIYLQALGGVPGGPMSLSNGLELLSCP